VRGADGPRRPAGGTVILEKAGGTHSTLCEPYVLVYGFWRTTNGPDGFSKIDDFDCGIFDIHQRCLAPFQLVIDRAVLLAYALLLFHHDPIQAKRFTCSAKVFATS
jgi:hypothetical protein